MRAHNYDNDGDLDLAVGNSGGANRVYRNDGHAVFELIWTSQETDGTESISWGDYDGDGDLDLGAGNDGQSNRVYQNDGGGSFNLAWSSPEQDQTRSLRWGDYDADGDLDMAMRAACGDIAFADSEADPPELCLPEECWEEFDHF